MKIFEKHKWTNWQDLEIHYVITATSKQCYLLQTRTRDDGKKQFKDVLISRKVEFGTTLSINLTN